MLKGRSLQVVVFLMWFLGSIIILDGGYLADSAGCMEVLLLGAVGVLA